MLAAVDDSHILIDGRPHTILAAVLIADAEGIEQALQELKRQFGVSVQDEIKWNGMNLEQRDREALSQELLVTLHEAAALVTICEGTDRQQAAELLALQLADYFDANAWQDGSRLEITFDEGILSDGKRYAQFLSDSGRALLERVPPFEVSDRTPAALYSSRTFLQASRALLPSSPSDAQTKTSRSGMTQLGMQ